MVESMMILGFGFVCGCVLMIVLLALVGGNEDDDD
jgi:hypothetical protein